MMHGFLKITDMKEDKLGLEPAFPVVETKNIESIELGISKRFYAACAAMQGLLANSEITEIVHRNVSKAIKDCYMLADELLKQENE